MLEKYRRFLPAVLIALASSFLLGGYEMVRSPSNTLFKAFYGVENLPIVMAIMPLGVLLILYVYGRILSLLGPRKTLMATTLFSALFLVLCYQLIELKWRPASALLYIYREAYIVLIIEQYWSLINSTYSVDEAKSFNGYLIGLSSLGAIASGYFISQTAVSLGTSTMLLFAALALLPTMFFAGKAYKIAGEPKPLTPEASKDTIGLKEFKTSSILILLIGLVLVNQVASAGLGLNFQNILQEAIPDPDQQTAYSGRFFMTVNIFAAGSQFLLTPFLLKRFSPMKIQLFIPLVNLAFVFAAFFVPTLPFVGAAYLCFKSLDYSLFRAAKEVLYIPLSFNARFRAKEVVDVFGYRLGKGGSSVAFVLLEKVGIALAGFYGAIAAAATSLWFVLILFYPKKYRITASQNEISQNEKETNF